MDDIDNDLIRHKSYLQTTVSLRAYLLNDQVYHDSLSRYLKRAARDFQLFPKTGAFESLKSRGLEILTNDTLRLEITDLFQLGIYSLISLGREESQTRNITKIIAPYLSKHLTISNQATEIDIIPLSEVSDTVTYYNYEILNYDQLRDDQTLLSVLENVIEIRVFKMNRHLSLIEQIKKVVADIDKELVRLNT